MIAALLALAAAADPPKLDITAFFAGRTHGDNLIKIALHAPHKLTVDSVGGRNKEGEFVLIETVHEEGKPARTRTWVMHPAGPDRLTGVLTDALGPVEVSMRGDSATIAYVMKEGHLKVTQEIRLEGDGRTLTNHVIAKKFGIGFAHVDGTIRKLD